MKIHWFGVTIKADYDYTLQLWNYFFSFELGNMVNTSRAGRGFQHIDTALHEAKLYWLPFPQSSINYDYCHIELTGDACDAVLPSRFTDFIGYLIENSIEFKVTRLDLAFDNMPFTPHQFYERVCGDTVSTLAKRESISFHTSPYYVRQDGGIGSDTCYIGSRSSTRFVRVYNERGFTRLEFVVKDIRAHHVALDLFLHNYEQWATIGKAHLLDNIRFTGWSAWDEFITNSERAFLTISAARKVSLSKIRNWITFQVGVSLSVIYDVLGSEDARLFVEQVVKGARLRDRQRYKPVLELGNPFAGIQNIKTLVYPEFLDDWDLQEPCFEDLEDGGDLVLPLP